MAPKASAHAVYDLKYHFVWTPKYRKEQLIGEVAEATEEILGEIAEAYDMEIDTLEVMEDHVHLFVSCPGDADLEKRVCEGVVCTIPLAKAEAMGRGTMGRRIFCSLSRRPSNSRNHKTTHTLPKECQKCSAITMERNFLKAPQLAAG